MDPNIVRSPLWEKAKNVPVPNISLPEYLFQALDMNYEVLKDQAWVVDVIKGTSYKFAEIKPLTKKIASALTKLGFKKGDTFFYATYDMALIYMVHIGVWLCGGAVRGCFPKEEPREFARQMREMSARFILCDNETEKSIKGAVKQLEWQVQLISIGSKVEGVTAIEDLLANEDGTDFPHNVTIEPKEDVCLVVNTSGSSGNPKGVLHTHTSFINFFASIRYPKKTGEWRIFGKSGLSAAGNFLISAYAATTSSIMFGFSLIGISKFDQNKLITQIMTYKPELVFLYPYIANAFAKSDELNKLDLSFLKYLLTGGSVFNLETARTLASKLPHLKIKMIFGMSEILFLTCSSMESAVKIPEGELVAGLKPNLFDGEWRVSCGALLPMSEAKIMDPTLKCSVGRNIKGSLWIRSSSLMKGYLNSESDKGFISGLDEDGWFDTGDIAYFDDADYLYIVDRNSSTFKYFMHWVSPAEIESIIAEHPAVSAVGVVGIPNTISTSAARAYVVLKPGYKATEEEIKQYVAGKTIDYKHLHGGVRFLDKLPENSGGKINKTALLKMA